MRFQLLLAMALLPLFTACTSTASNPERAEKELPVAGTWKNRSGDTSVTIASTASGGFTIESATLYVHMNNQGYETKRAPEVIPGDPPTMWRSGDKSEWSQVLSTHVRYLEDTQRTLSQTRAALESFDQPEVQALIPPLMAMEKAVIANKSAKVAAASRQLARVINPPRPRPADVPHVIPVINNLSPELPASAEDDAATFAH